MKYFNHLVSAIAVLLIFIGAGNRSVAQTNTTVATAFEIPYFPYTVTNVNSDNGSIATGMQGSCNSIQCCPMVVYKWSIPVKGSIRIELDNYEPLANSLITYKAITADPQDWTDIQYVPSPGNFCGYRDTCQIGRAYDWWGGTGWADDTLPVYEPTISPGTYYTLVFTSNTQSMLGAGTSHNITFQYRPFCPDGYTCGTIGATICDGSPYTLPSGLVVDSTGNYVDTLFGQGAGGLDSLIFAGVSYIGDTTYTDTTYQDTTLGCGVALDVVAATENVAIGTFVNSNNDYVTLHSLSDSLAGSNRSVFMWMQTPSNVSSSADALFGINTSSGGNVSIFQIGTADKVGLNHGSGTSYGTTDVTATGWHFVGYTYEESTGATKVWVDGVIEDSFTNSQTVSATDIIALAAEYDSGPSPGNYLKGDLAEVTVWTEVLDSAGVADLMAMGPSSSHPFYDDLLAYYPFGSGSCPSNGGILEDFSGNGHHGTLSSTSIIDPLTLVEISGCNGAPGYEAEWTSSATGSLGSSHSVTIAQADAGTIDLSLTRPQLEIATSFVVTPTMDLSVTENGGTVIKANQAGATYQWLDCDNSYATVANTTDSLSANDGYSGNYAVAITYNGCTDTTECYAVMGATCAAPTNLEAKRLTHNSARLLWDVVSGANAYRVWYKALGASGWTKVIKSSNQGRRDITGLTASTKYRWMVQARCSGDWGPLADGGAFVTFDGACTTPDTATLSANPVQSTQARLNWSTTPFTYQYQIQYRPQGGNWTGELKDATWDKHWLVGLTPGTTYEWRIRSKCKADNVFNTGEWSAIQQFTTAAASPKRSVYNEQNPFAARVVLYPNPAQSTVNMTLMPTLLDNTVSVYNMMGQVLHTQRIEAGETAATMYLDHLPNGMYIVQFTGGFQATKRLIIE